MRRSRSSKRRCEAPPGKSTFETLGTLRNMRRQGSAPLALAGYEHVPFISRVLTLLDHFAEIQVS
jgi:hypothetical protein